MSRRILIAGFGRLGQVFYRLYHAQYEIRGVKRSPLPGHPCPVALMPIRSPAMRQELAWADIVLFCPATSRGGGRQAKKRGDADDLARYRETYQENMEYLVDVITRDGIALQAVILIGSTGVYPRAPGVWSEERPIPIDTPRQEILLDTEQALISSGLPAVVLRSGGIYGEGRNNFLWIGRTKVVRSSELTDEPIALVHQDDLCGVVARIIEHGIAGEVFNVRDDTMFTRRELFTRIAARAGVSIDDDGPPPSAGARSIPNAKLKSQLGYRFHGPPITTYLDGVSAG